MKSPNKQALGALVAAATLCGSIVLPITASAQETDPASGGNSTAISSDVLSEANLSEVSPSASTTSETDSLASNPVPPNPSEATPTKPEDSSATDKSTPSASTKAGEEGTNQSAPTKDAQQDSNQSADTKAHEGSSNQSANTKAAEQNSPQATNTKDELKQLLEKTTTDNLEPPASGGDAASSTAPYDRVAPNAEDIKTLETARKEAQQVIDDGSASEDSIQAASDKLSKAFESVRFVYHYTGITGTNGARVFDNNGNLIQAHGAGIQKVDANLLGAADKSIDANGDGYIYAWCGEDKTDRLVAHGVRIYYSDDLYNWVDKGLGFQTYLGDKDLDAKLKGSDTVYQKYYNVENIAKDPDYTNIYGEDFSTFANDKANYNIDSAQDALDKMLWDLKALYGDGSNATKTSAVFERPKMAYSASTNRWVIWFHADGPQYGNEDTATYSKAKAGVAISEGSDPAGPYKYLGSFRMSPGNNSDNPGMARDMNLYIDDKDANGDGVNDAYLIYSSNENRDLTISLLDSTYTKLVKPVSQQQKGNDVEKGDTYNIAATNSKESPAPFKWNGKYYIIYSETTGWAPNENKYTISEGDSILGPYHEAGTPFVEGEGAHQSPSNSFTTQSSSVIPYDAEKGIFIYWGDRWFNPDTGNDISQSRYVMTPMRLINGKLQVLPAADWQLEDLQQYQAIDVLTELPTETGSMSDLMASLPNELEVKLGGESTSMMTPVVWDTYFGDDQPTGTVTVTGHLSELNDAPISFVVTVYPKNMILFMDAGSDASNESDYYTALNKQAELMGTNADHSDQQYSEGEWGLSSAVGEDNNDPNDGTDVAKYTTSGTDIYETGYWAKANKTIEYKADLPAGTYTVQAGYKEWWSNKRQTVFTVSVADADGSSSEELGGASIVPSGSGNATDAMRFTLDDAKTVTFSTKSNGGGDPVLSWISVSKVTPDQVVSVAALKDTVAFLEGDAPSMPDTVTVTKADGSTEERSVDWKLGDTSKLKPFALNSVQGVVEGTSLPAKAQIQQVPKDLEYFVDVAGMDSDGNSSSSYESAVQLTEGAGGALRNEVADQTFDADESVAWGNTSSNFGTKSVGSADPYESGIYAGKDGKSGSLSYALTLSPGEHTVMFGMHDWWNQSRPTTITYQIAGEGSARDSASASAGSKVSALTDSTSAESAPVEFASADVNSGFAVASGKVDIPGDTDQLVTFTLESSAGTGPVLSWISSSQQTTDPVDPEPGENVKPTISGVENTTIAVGDAFDPLSGITASDEEDGDLTSKITVSGSVDTKTEGTYELEYSVTDSTGASAVAKRTVTVKAADGSGPGSGSEDPDNPGNPSDPGKNDGDASDSGTNRPNGIASTGSTVIGVAALSVLLVALAAGLALWRRRHA